MRYPNDPDYYMNMGTGEITEIHRIAMEWWREGYNIGLYKKDVLRLTWEH